MGTRPLLDKEVLDDMELFSRTTAGPLSLGLVYCLNLNWLNKVWPILNPKNGCHAYLFWGLGEQVNMFFICQVNQQTAQFPKSAPKADVPNDGMKSWYANDLPLLNHTLWEVTIPSISIQQAFIPA